MKHTLCIFFSILFLLSACSPSLAAQPTNTPAPTETSQPTSTPLPSETPTTVPTSTPDKTATAAAHATETAASVLAELDTLLKDSDIPYQQGHLAWQQTKSMRVSLSGPSDASLAIGDNLLAKNFVLKSDVTWEATGIIVCGFILRSEPDLKKGKQYQLAYLRLSGLPAWRLDYYELGRFKYSPSSMQYSDVIDQGNHATNQVVVVAQDDRFTVYFNKVEEGSYLDNGKQRMEGTLALQGYQESGKGYCDFENSWVWALD